MKKRTMPRAFFWTVNLVLFILLGLLAGCPRKHRERSLTAPANPPAIVLNLAQGTALRAKVVGLTVTISDQASGAVVDAQTFADPAFPLSLELDVAIPPCLYTITAAAVLRDGSTNSASASVDACALAGAAITLAIVTEEPMLPPAATPTAIPINIFTVTPIPMATPTNLPTVIPTAIPTLIPTAISTLIPTATPTLIPTATPTETPVPPTATPTAVPTNTPAPVLTATPTETPVLPVPTETPTETPMPPVPTETPTETPMPPIPTETPTETPMPPVPTETPTETPVPPVPTETPTETPMPVPCVAAGPVSDGSNWWYLGAINQSCADVCATHGGVSVTAQNTVECDANGGTDAECDRILGILGAPVGGTFGWWAGSGACVFDNLGIRRARFIDSPNQPDTWAYGDGCRACACVTN